MFVSVNFCPLKLLITKGHSSLQHAGNASIILDFIIIAVCNITVTLNIISDGGTEMITSQLHIPFSPNCVMLRKYSLLDLNLLSQGEHCGDEGCLSIKDQQCC